jgi:hypothetical protein
MAASSSGSGSGSLNRFFGGSPIAVVLKLVLLSVVIGVLMSVLGLDAFAIIRSIERMIRGLFENFSDAIETITRWFLLGAVIVFPIWLLLRLSKVGRS